MRLIRARTLSIIVAYWMIGCGNSVVGENNSAEDTEDGVSSSTGSKDEENSSDVGGDTVEDANTDGDADERADEEVAADDATVKEDVADTDEDSIGAEGVGTDQVDDIDEEGVAVEGDADTAESDEHEEETIAVNRTDADTNIGTESDTGVDDSSGNTADSETNTGNETASNMDTDTEANDDTGSSNASSTDTDSAAGKSCDVPLTLSCGDVVNHSTVINGRASEWNGYACTARWEGGPETIYYLETNDDCEVEISLDQLGKDIDIFLAPDCDLESANMLYTIGCSSSPFLDDIEHISYSSLAGDGHYLIVDGYDEAAGDYTLEVNCICSDDTETPSDWTDCSERTEETCESDTNCRVVTGRRAAENNSCFESDQIDAGCASRGSSICDTDMVQVVDEDGVCWEMFRYCHIPSGFHSASGVTCPATSDACGTL